MEFEWDQAKAQANLEKHGIAFELAQEIFDRPHLNIAAKPGPGGEVRAIAIGPLRGHIIAAVVHTDRSGRIRIISARPASRRERRLWNANSA